MNPILPYNEAAILQKVSVGDAAAFTGLFKHWHPKLALYIFRITRSKELTAEIVQDVFLKIWISREALANVDNFNNYLFIVSRNHAINVLRKTMRERAQMKAWESELHSNTKTVSPGDTENETDIYSLVDEAIEHLPPRQKQVFLLHRHQRLTYIQIAEQLKIGRESVKTHLGLAVRAISRYLSDRASVLFLISAVLKKIF